MVPDDIVDTCLFRFMSKRTVPLDGQTYARLENEGSFTPMRRPSPIVYFVYASTQKENVFATIIMFSCLAEWMSRGPMACDWADSSHWIVGALWVHMARDWRPILAAWSNVEPHKLHSKCSYNTIVSIIDTAATTLCTCLVLALQDLNTSCTLTCSSLSIDRSMHQHECKLMNLQPGVL